jgi:fructuronate reductase
MNCLSEATLEKLPDVVKRPSYDRSAVRPGIVHLGLGAFHRAHQAVFVDECLRSGAMEWGIIGASLRRPETRDALARQDWLYTLCTREGDKEQLGVVGSIVDILVAPEAPEALLAMMARPEIRIVTLTVTEKAYLRNASGNLDRNNADILADLADPKRPRTAHGYLVEALARRRAAGVKPFTVLSCDNLPENGRTLRRLVTEFAAMRCAELAHHIQEEVAFPSSVVDRIVPATTADDRKRMSRQLGVDDAWPVVSEPFSQWVVEEDFPLGRPDWTAFGVTMVADVTPHEMMKLRMLNGAHSAIAYIGQLLGLETVADAFANPAVSRFVDGLWAEIAPTLPVDAGLDSTAYATQLKRRFSNTALRHRTAQIANDGSQKLPQRIVSAAIERLAGNHRVDHLALVIATWIAALSARGEPPAFTDPLDAQLRHASYVVAEVFVLAGFAPHTSEMAQLEALVATSLSSLKDNGVEETLMQIQNKGHQS